MGMPRKGSRKVEIDGVMYLWRLAGWRRYYGETPFSFTLTCQRDEERPGRVMQARLRSTVEIDEYELEQGSHRATVNPSEVRQIVAHALSKGWDPSERGPAFKLPVLDKQPALAQYEIVGPI